MEALRDPILRTCAAVDEIAEPLERFTVQRAGRRFWLALVGLVILFLLALADGCTSQAVKDQAVTECAIHDGYVRLIREGKATPAQLEAFVRASRRAWYAQRLAATGEGAARPTDEPVAP